MPLLVIHDFLDPDTNNRWSDERMLSIMSRSIFNTMSKSIIEIRYSKLVITMIACLFAHRKSLIFSLIEVTFGRIDCLLSTVDTIRHDDSGML